PDGHLYVSYLSHDDRGKAAPLIARWHADGTLERFSIGAGGGRGLSFDRHGQLFAGDANGLFYILPGIDFRVKAAPGDEDIPTEVSSLICGTASSVLAYAGNAWPGENLD